MSDATVPSNVPSDDSYEALEDVERRFGADPWRLVQDCFDHEHLGTDETLFALANGYIGVRGTPEEGRDAVAHGTFVNGLHETWQIRHAESAFGFARTGQTIVNAPDATVLKVYVDDEPLALGVSELESFERILDMRNGLLCREVVWRTPSGKRVRVSSTRMVSMTQRHLTVMSLEVTLLTGDAPVAISSQLLNRQDGQDDYHVATPPPAEQEEGAEAMEDPRKTARFTGRVMVPELSSTEDDRITLGYRVNRSGMTVAVSAGHVVSGVPSEALDTVMGASDDRAKAVFRFDAVEGQSVRIDKFVAHHSSRGVPVHELSDRCDRTIDRAVRTGADALYAEQEAWFSSFWDAADVRLGADERTQQAVRFSIFQLAQAAARSDGQGIGAKGVTGSGYEGHYFWDTEIYVVPFLTYTLPEVARNVLHFRRTMLPAARARAAEMAQSGALFPWRTINGEEASAYYAAGTAQMHINGDVVYACIKYVLATGDEEFLRGEGADLLVETARMWADLGFWRYNGGDPSFHIHGVTGPDEYTTVVNNNLFTNLMARFNLLAAATVLERLHAESPDVHRALVERLAVHPDEVAEWRRCGEGMNIPFDSGLGIHPQDDSFLDREVWDLSQTPAEQRPLLLNYHPLVIYRFQVLKQADVVLGLFLHGNLFSAEEKRADFEYYDPITTGDSTLSAVVQSIMAAEVGYHEVADAYFAQALATDIDDTHDNTVDGIHVASAGGVWSGLVFGFGGMRDHGGQLSFDPRLPVAWEHLDFTVAWHGRRIDVHLVQDAITFTLRPVADQVSPDVVTCETVTVQVRGEDVLLTSDESVRVPLADQGPRIDGLLGDRPHIGGVRADGSRITAGVPTATANVEYPYDPYAPWRTDGEA